VIIARCILLPGLRVVLAAKAVILTAEAGVGATAVNHQGPRRGRVLLG
jgi:hypothetical protein